MAMKLKELREKQCFSQREVAEKLNMVRQTYACYELGVNEPNIESLIKLADFFQVSIDYLVERKNNSYEIGNLSVSQLELLKDLKDLSDADVKRVQGYIKALKDK